MCGITGFIDLYHHFQAEQYHALLSNMAKTLSHRGPDDQGIWHDVQSGVGLAHRRLSIIDTTVKGHQPMISPTGRYVIVFNGEIYNYLEIRKALLKYKMPFQGRSDTEVLLAAVDHWGLDETLRRLNGMFAFGLWDRNQRRLYLARDRVGIKPLYYGWVGDQMFGFASELKPFHVFPNFQPHMNSNALQQLLEYGYISAPLSIYQGIFKLLPGEKVIFYPNQSRIEQQKYWSAYKMACEGIQNTHQGSDQEILDELETLLKQSVRQRMVSDVPLGAFLSGGIDSSLIVSLLQSQSTQAVKTFSIGFNEKSHNEAHYAKEVAKHLGTDHVEYYVPADEAAEVIPHLPTIYDEPFADVSQIPTYLVSQLARNHVTVSLSGDGGDELFGGYDRYIWAMRLWRLIRGLPKQARVLVGNLLTLLPPALWDQIVKIVLACLPLRRPFTNPGDKICKLANIIKVGDRKQLYQNLLKQVVTASPLVMHETPQSESSEDVEAFMEMMMLKDLIGYLPNDILTKLDRASMAVGLEARVPLLDHEVIQYAWQMPLSMKMKQKRLKWPLRQLLYRYLPSELVDRPKMGFGVPIGAWLRTHLREWAEDLLDEKRLKDQGLINAIFIHQRWQEHLSGRRNWQYFLWNVLVFEGWYKRLKSTSFEIKMKSFK